MQAETIPYTVTSEQDKVLLTRKDASMLFYSKIPANISEQSEKI